MRSPTEDEGAPVLDEIIVSHAQKQHVYRLVAAIKHTGRFKRFFVSFFFAKEYWLTKLLMRFDWAGKFVKKRTIDGIEQRDVVVTFVPEIVYHVNRFIAPRMRGYYMGRVHDNIVSLLLMFTTYDAIVGYECQCLKSFKRAKAKGKVTILDLASIHAAKQREINQAHGNVITGFKPSRLLGVEKPVKEKELALTDYVITLSEFAKMSCIEAGIDPAKIFTVHLGLNIEMFSPKTQYDQQHFEVLFVAGMRHWKGIKDLVDAFERCAFTDAKLTLVGGTGDALGFVRDHEGAQITYIPHLYQNELIKLYQRASVFVLPSYMDSWGQVVPEAMACGTPVIVSEYTGAKDLVVEGENGFIVNAGDTRALRDKMTYFYDHREAVERMGKKARASVEHLTWQYYDEQIGHVLNSVEQQYRGDNATV